LLKGSRDALVGQGAEGSVQDNPARRQPGVDGSSGCGRRSYSVAESRPFEGDCFPDTEPSRVGASYSLHLEVYAHVLEGDLAIQAAHAASASRLAGGPTMS
jgi:hypothetical protein